MDPFTFGESAARKHRRCWGQRGQSLDSSLLNVGCHVEAAEEERPQAPAEKGWARDPQGSPRLLLCLVEGQGICPRAGYGVIISGVLVYPPQA